MMSSTQPTAFSRRSFLQAAAVCAAAAAGLRTAQAQTEPFRFRYILASSLYGELPLAEILPEVHKSGASEIDIWPKVHGNQREQIEEMGHDAFLEMLQAHDVRLGIITRYDLGPYRLQDEMAVVKQLGGDMIVAGSGKQEGDTLRKRMAKFVEAMKPHVAVAEELGVTIAIENHANALLESPDSLRYFAEMSPSERLGIAYAPYHLPQDPELQARLITDLGPRLVHFYAWEHGMGSRDKLPKVQEMKQLPGSGSFDFGPVVEALRAINYAGRTSIFMHPVPRGIPVLPTAPEVTTVLNRSREYLESLLPGNDST
ncbi:MAG: hypothetical protein AMXMBFR82_21840 [Candidatus Hydrogenedentota bacterium]